MRNFSERRKRYGKIERTADSKRFFKKVDIANYVPTAYVYNYDYARFMSIALKNYATLIRNSNCDVDNIDMFFSQVDVQTKKMLDNIHDQYTYHIALLNHHRSIHHGENSKLEAAIAGLYENIARYDREIDRLTVKKESLERKESKS